MAAMVLAAQPAPARTTKALFLSDVHFDPFVEAATVAKLRDLPEGRWRTILKAQNRTLAFPACGDAAATTTPELLSSALTNISRQHPTFTVLTGDLLVHQFQCRFATLFPNAPPEQYREFAARTFLFVLQAVRNATHGRPVYVVLGNHDSGCGNYRRDDADWFLRRLAPAVARASGADISEREAIAESFARSGRYEVATVPGLSRTSILAVDTSLWSRQGQTCAGTRRDEDEGQLDWLAERLAANARAGRHSWLIGHIPPGIDARASASAGQPVGFDRDDAFAQVIARSAPTLTLTLFGHTHMDEWRLLGGVLVRLSPSLTPGSGNNPAYTIADIGPGGELLDYSVHIRRMSSQRWTQLYDFRTYYGGGSFNPPHLADLIGQIANNDSQVSKKYTENFSAAGTTAPTSPDGSRGHFICAMSSVTRDDFAHCLQSGPWGN